MGKRAEKHARTVASGSPPQIDAYHLAKIAFHKARSRLLAQKQPAVFAQLDGILDILTIVLEYLP